MDGKVKEINSYNKENYKLTVEAIPTMATPQAKLVSISKQIQDMQSELKADLNIFKEDIATQIQNELTEF